MTDQQSRHANHAEDDPGAVCSDPAVLLSPVESRIDAVFRRDYPLAWWTTLAWLVVVTFVLLLVREIMGVEYLWRLVATVIVTIFIFGEFRDRETIRCCYDCHQSPRSG